jgi:hypothetical protein
MKANFNVECGVVLTRRLICNQYPDRVLKITVKIIRNYFFISAINIYFLLQDFQSQYFSNEIQTVQIVILKHRKYSRNFVKHERTLIMDSKS